MKRFDEDLFEVRNAGFTAPLLTARNCVWHLNNVYESQSDVTINTTVIQKYNRLLVYAAYLHVTQSSPLTILRVLLCKAVDSFKLFIFFIDVFTTRDLICTDLHSLLYFGHLV